MKTKISAVRLESLNQGMVESSNLMESIAIDFNILLSSFFLKPEYPIIDSSIGIIKRMKLVAEILKNEFGEEIHTVLKNHSSDTARGWGCYIISLMNKSFIDSLPLIMPFAADHHFGVREWAWLALRDKFKDDLKKSIHSLLCWVQSDDENLRRFAVEISRPRGVWCAHVPELRKKPEIALELLNHVKADNSLYVKKSVGNWLNDAAKDNINWVQDLCEEWQKASNNKHTKFICKRGLRILKHA